MLLNSLVRAICCTHFSPFSDEHITEYVANFVNSFLEEQRLQNESLELGVDLGFPVEKTALNAGKLLAWTKGYDVKNAVGKDVLQLLQDAFNRKHLKVKCIVQLNDVSFSILDFQTTMYNVSLTYLSMIDCCNSVIIQPALACLVRVSCCC